MVQLKTEPSSPGQRPRQNGKPKSKGANGVFAQPVGFRDSFSAVLAKAGKAAKAAADAMKSREKPAEKVSAQAEKRLTRREDSPEKAETRRESRVKELKSSPTEKGAESGFRLDAASMFRESRDTVPAVKSGPEGGKENLSSVSVRSGGWNRIGENAAAGKKMLDGTKSGNVEQTLFTDKSDRPRKAREDSEKTSKTPRDARMERLKEKLKEKPKEAASQERPEQKDAVPSQVMDDSRKDGPKETFEIRVSDRSGVLEKIAGERNLREGMETRELSSQILKQFREEGNAALVRSAKIVLKDRDEGEIRLILKPEKLGEVRIRLHLQDRLIDGRILVENSSVRDAFEQNLQDLAAAFRESGFELGNLDVSVGNGGEGRSESESPKLADGRKTVELERSVPRVEALKYYASNAVNIMV